MTKNPQRNPELSPAALTFLLIGLGATAGIGASLMHSAGQLALVPMVIGMAGMAFRVRSAPLVLLAAVAIGQVVPHVFDVPALFPRRGPVGPDLALCAAVLVYVVAQYRLFGLTTGVFPPDVHSPADPPPPREVSPVSRELVPAGLMVAAAVVGAFFLWEVLDAVPPPWRIYRAHWRVGLLAWLLIGGLSVAAAVISHLGWRRLSGEEAAMFLQDALWHETRGDQRRINRWRAWAARRR
jgi:hypothetical protein